MKNENEIKSSEISDEVNNSHVHQLENKNKCNATKKEKDKKQNINITQIEESNTNKDENTNFNIEEINEVISNEKEEINPEDETDYVKKNEIEKKEKNIIEQKDDYKDLKKEKEIEVDVDKNLKNINKNKEEKINLNENEEESLNLENNIKKEISNKDSFNQEQIGSQVEYNYIYFIIKYEIKKDLNLSFIQNNFEATIENVRKIKNENETIDLYRIQIEKDKIPEDNNLKILMINNKTKFKSEDNEIIIHIEKDIKELFIYIINSKIKSTELLFLRLAEQFKMYIEFLNQVESKENKYENLIISTLKFFEINDEYSFSLYILFFLEFYKSNYVSQILKLFDYDKLILSKKDINEEVKNKINILANNPNEIFTEDITNKEDLLQIFYKIITIFNYNFQTDKLEYLLENQNNNIYFEKFISYIPKNSAKNIKFSKKVILKLLSYAKNISDVNNILLIAGKDIITIFEILLEKEQEINELYKKDNKKLILEKYIEIKQDDNINNLSEIIYKLSKNKSLGFLKFSKTIITKYIEWNTNNIDNLLHLKNIIINLGKEEIFSNDINKIIHDLILESDEKKREYYFIKDDYYFKDEYINSRSLDILKGFDIDKLININQKIKFERPNNNLEKIFNSKLKELHNLIKQNIHNINDIKKLDELFEIKQEKLKKEIIENILSNTNISVTPEDINLIFDIYKNNKYILPKEININIKLFEGALDMMQIKKILKISDHDIKYFFKLLGNKKILELYKKENNINNKIIINEYLETNQLIKNFFHELNIFKYNNNIECFEVSTDIFEKYIKMNENDLKILMKIKELIKDFSNDTELTKKINKLIHELIIKSDKSTREQYFIKDEIYFNDDYEKFRNIEILKDIDIIKLNEINEKIKKEKNNNLEKIFATNLNELYKHIKKNIQNINEIALLDNLFEQKDEKFISMKKQIIENILPKKSRVLLSQDIDLINSFYKENNFALSDNLILKLLDKANNMTQIKNILKISEKNINSFFTILNNDNINEQYKKEKNNKIVINDYLELNSNDYINKFFEEIKDKFLDNKKSLKCFEISSELFKKYIEIHNNNIEKLFDLKEIINQFSSDFELKKKINEIIHGLILNSNENIRENYFIKDEIYFNDDYKKLRNIDILRGFDLKKLININKKIKAENKSNLENIFGSKLNELYEFIRKIIQDINDINSLDNLFEKKDENFLNFKKQIIETLLFKTEKLLLKSGDIDFIINFYLTNNLKFPNVLMNKLLDNSTDMTQIQNILKLSDKKVTFFEILNNKKIDDLYKKQKNKKIKLKECLKLETNEDINSFFEEIMNNEGNKLILKFLEIPSDIFDKYIELNKDDVDKLCNLREIINHYYKDLKLKKDFNEVIHEQIITLNKNKEYNYFIKDDIYFKNEYESKRTLDIFDGYDLDKLIELNNFLKKEQNNNLENIFSSQKEELYKTITSLIKCINGIKKLFSIIEKENQILNNYIGNSFKTLLNEENLDNNKINDIYNLVVFCIRNKLDLGNKLIEILKVYKDKNIFKNVVILLINSGNDILIQRSLDYLEDDLFLLLEIINSNKDVVINYLNKNHKKIEIKSSFIPKENENIEKINKQLNSLVENQLISLIQFFPTNFTKIIEDKRILSFIIQNLHKQDKLNQWNLFIIKNLISEGKFKGKDLLELINLEENNEIKKEFLTIDVFDKININDLNEENCLNEFKKSSLIQIFSPLYKELSEKIVNLLKNKEISESIKYILEETIKQLNIKENLKPISAFTYLIFKNIQNQLIIDFIWEKIKNIFSDKLLDIYLNLEKEKELPSNCKNIFLDYLIGGNNIKNIMNLMEKSKSQKDILSKINPELIIKAETLDDLEKLIKEDNNSYKLLKGIKKFVKEYKEDINYIKPTNEILNKLKEQLDNINYWNYKNIGKFTENQDLMDILFLDEVKKHACKVKTKAMIKKYKSYNFNLILIILISVFMSFLMPKMFVYINYNNEEIKYVLTDNNWNIFNISKELAQSEYVNYSFEIDLSTKIIESQNDHNYDKYKFNNVIITIDFGSINTGYQYIINSKNNSNKYPKIENNEKSPNEIEISRINHNGLKYALKASVSLANYRYEEMNKINFIKGIKTLFNIMNSNYSDNLCYIYPKDFIISMNITHVIKEYFLLIKNDILQKFKEERINTNAIEWIFSVPQSWNEFEKQIILNSAKDSGLSKISLIYESEAAALSIYTDKNIPDNLIKRKQTFILMDIGGINTQFSIYEINNDYIKEKIQIKNNLIENCGFLNIVEKIINVMEIIFGKKNINNIKKDDPGNWLKILKDIHKAIENTYRINGIEIFDIFIPFSYKGKYEYSFEHDNKIKKYEIKYDKYNLLFPAGLIGEFIHESSQKIINNINLIISELKSKRIGINNIVVTGGFSKNKILQSEIKNNFIGNNQMNIHYLTSYHTAISKGGIYYGFNKTIINSRFSQETIGIKAGNSIQTILEKDKSMNNDFSKTILIKPSINGQKIIQINIYASNKNKILNENDFVGRVIIYLNNGNNNDIIKVKIYYDIVLSFHAYEAKSGKEIKTKFEYFK